MYVISLKIDSQNAHPSAKKAKKRLSRLGAHLSAENEKNTFLSKILSFFENSRKKPIPRANFGNFCRFFLHFLTKKLSLLGREL